MYKADLSGMAGIMVRHRHFEDTMVANHSTSGRAAKGRRSKAAAARDAKGRPLGARLRGGGASRAPNRGWLSRQGRPRGGRARRGRCVGESVHRRFWRGWQWSSTSRSFRCLLRQIFADPAKASRIAPLVSARVAPTSVGATAGDRRLEEDKASTLRSTSIQIPEPFQPFLVPTWVTGDRDTARRRKKVWGGVH